MILTPGTAEFSHMLRRDDVSALLAEGGVGVELGVAEGVFSERILERSKLGFLYSIDMYAGDRGHDVGQYKRALTRLMRFRGRNTILKMRFDEALDLFDDASLDFVYVDGYAHTGEEEGRTFHDWWPKLKPGAIFAGDDYDPVQWPGVVAHLDAFLAREGLDAYLIPCAEKGVDYCEFPTWFLRKP